MTKASNYFNHFFTNKTVFGLVLLASGILPFMTITEVNQNPVLADTNQNQSEEIQLAQTRNRERERHQPIDNRHNITAPSEDLNRWLETIKRARANDLFRTLGGLNGHFQQIQQEVDRVKNTARETNDATSYNSYVNAIKTVRHSLISSARNANFDFERIELELYPLASNLSLERHNGRLYVDGKEQ